jgi:threonine/homoserine/homoserine lactone efflux protein
MCDGRTIAAFVVASAAIILAPGPAQALVLARTLERWRRAGLTTALGLNAATLVHALAAALGLSALLATSAAAFTVVKLAGAAYLFYLGIQALRASATPSEEAAPVTDAGSGRALSRAFLTGLLNPKVAVFFLAFLPQFVCPDRGSVVVQFVVLGTLLAVMDVIYESCLVFLAAGTTSWLRTRRAHAWRSRVTGAVLVGLALRLAVQRR